MGAPAGSGTLNACPSRGWEDVAEAVERSDEVVRPNYLSLTEARGVVSSEGADSLNSANRAGHAGRRQG